MSNLLSTVSDNLLFVLITIAILLCMFYQVASMLATSRFFIEQNRVGVFGAVRENEEKNQESSRNQSFENDKPVLAGLPISNKALAFLRVGASLVAFGIGLLLSNFIVGVAGAVIIFIGSHLWLEACKEKNKLVLEVQINQLEMQMAENSRAGLSITRSLRTCFEQYDNPIKTYLERIINELVYTGATLSEAFEHFAESSESDDAKVLANVIAVQQETGSSLADTLDFLSQSIAERQKMRQTLRSRLAEMRLTKIMVALTPLLIIVLCCFAIKGVSDFYLTNPLGWALLGFCALGEIVGIYALNRLSQLPIE